MVEVIHSIQQAFKTISSFIFITLLCLFVSCQQDHETTVEPVKISIEPPQARPGATVTIHGDGFAPDMRDNVVSFNGLKAEVLSLDYKSDGPDELTVKVPLNASAGPVTIVAKNRHIEGPDFQIIGPHTIISVSPQEALPGAEVTITGTGFSAIAEENHVWLNMQSLHVISASETTLKVLLPEESSSGDIRVEILGLEKYGPLITVIRKSLPSIVQVSPVAGQIGTEVRITGKNFADVAEKNIVTFNGIPTKVISQFNDNGTGSITLVVIVPEGASTGPVVVKVHDEQASWPQSFNVSAEAPWVNSLSLFPNSVMPGFKFSILGAGFSPEPSFNKVYIGSIQLNVLASSATALLLEVPRDIDFGTSISISENIKVLVNGHSSSSSANHKMFIWRKPIISLSTSSGKVGDEVRISSIIFPAYDPDAVKVFFTGPSETTIPAKVISVKDTELKVQVPQGAVTGKIYVQVYDGELGKSLVDYTITL